MNVSERLSGDLRHRPDYCANPSIERDKIASAVRMLAKRIFLASKALEDFGVSEDEIRELANRKIDERIVALGGLKQEWVTFTVWPHGGIL